MGRTLITAMLVTPILIFSGLYTFMRIEAGHRREREAAERMRLVSLPASISVNGKVIANPEAGAAIGAVAGAVGGAVPVQPPAAEAAKADGKLVRPESLEQGYILVVKDLAGLSSPASPIYLASSFNGWDPGDGKQKLTSRSDLRWQIIMPKAKSDAGLAFKFTRGNWDLEELSDTLQPISNRSLPLIDPSKLKPGEQPIFEFEVPKWGDQRPSSGARPDLDPYHKLDVKGNVVRMQVAGGGVSIATARDMIIYLPAEYDLPENASKTYQVLYLMDGQNLFEPLPGLPGEWKVDETAEELMGRNSCNPVIIVGIPHAGKGRSSEYTPFALVEGAEPRAKQFVEFLTGEVMPRIEKRFRVRVGPENTGIGGASLGGLVALYAACERPDVFGKALVESISGVGKDAKTLEFFKKYEKFPEMVYIGMGTAEGGKDPTAKELNDAVVQGAKALDALIADKAPKSKRKLVIDEGAEHNEPAWAKRFPEALRFLYPKYVRD